MVKQGYIYERERIKQLEVNNWFCLRVSGSIGAGDIFAIKLLNVESFNDGIFAVRYEQVKSCQGTTFYFNKRSKSELTRLQEIKQKFHIPCYFSVKLKRYGWKIIEITKDMKPKPIKWNN